jgi:hypothetical protein
LEDQEPGLRRAAARQPARIGFASPAGSATLVPQLQTIALVRSAAPGDPERLQDLPAFPTGLAQEFLQRYVIADPRPLALSGLPALLTAPAVYGHAHQEAAALRRLARAIG